MKTLILMLVLVFATAVLSGCAWFKPTTEIVFNPATGTVRFTDTKDNDIHFDKVSVVWNADDGSVLVDNFTAANKSSPVVYANVQQMLAFVEQQRAANEGITAALSGLNGIVQTLVPFLPLTQSTLSAVLYQLRQVQADIDVANNRYQFGPTSQPVIGE